MITSRARRRINRFRRKMEEALRPLKGQVITDEVKKQGCEAIQRAMRRWGHLLEGV